MKKTIIFSILVLFTTLILSCDYNTPEMRPGNSPSNGSTDNSSDNSFELSSINFKNKSMQYYYEDGSSYKTICNGANISIDIKGGSGTITYYITGTKQSKWIYLYSDGTFRSSECSGSYRILNNQLHLKGLNYKTNYANLDRYNWYAFY